MLNIKNIHLEHKLTAIFGFSAFVMSLLTGIIMGVTWSAVIIRSIVLMIVFAGIGFGTCIVLKKYVPEVYEFIVSIVVPHHEEISASGAGAQTEFGGPGGMPEDHPLDDAPEATQAAADSTFNELDKDMLAQYKTASETGGVNTATGKLGKHMLQTEKLAKYEPKIMAQAVRTMLKKEQ